MISKIYAFVSAESDDPQPRPWRYIFVIVLTLGVLFAGMGATSILLDPYQVFGFLNLKSRNFEMNTRYLKIEFLKKNKFEGFIMGNSGVNGYFAPTASALTGLKFYNLTAPNDSHDGAYKKLKWLIKNQPVKHIILGVSIGTQDKDPNAEHVNLAMFEHPEVSGKPFYRFFWRYLWVKPRMLAVAVYSNYVKKDTWWKFDVSNGHYHFSLLEKMIKQKTADELRTFRRSTVPPLAKGTTKINMVQLEFFRKTVDLARKNNVRVTVINPPQYPVTYQRFDMDTYGKWMREIIGRGVEMWDFSGINSITANEAMFFDTAHYSFEAGALALRRIFKPNHPSLVKHADYGFKVTSDNVEKRIAAHRRSQSANSLKSFK